MKRLTSILGTVAFALLFAYLQSAQAQIGDKDPNCPGTFAQSLNMLPGCVNPSGAPDPNDDIITPAEYQSICRNSVGKFGQAHARPATTDACIDKFACTEDEECWVCCFKPLQ